MPSGAKKRKAMAARKQKQMDEIPSPKSETTQLERDPEEEEEEEEEEAVDMADDAGHIIQQDESIPSKHDSAEHLCATETEVNDDVHEEKAEGQDGSFQDGETETINQSKDASDFVAEEQGINPIQGETECEIPGLKEDAAPIELEPESNVEEDLPAPAIELPKTNSDAISEIQQDAESATEIETLSSGAESDPVIETEVPVSQTTGLDVDPPAEPVEEATGPEPDVGVVIESHVEKVKLEPEINQSETSDAEFKSDTVAQGPDEDIQNGPLDEDTALIIDSQTLEFETEHADGTKLPPEEELQLPVDDEVVTQLESEAVTDGESIAINSETEPTISIELEAEEEDLERIQQSSTDVTDDSKTELVVETSDSKPSEHSLPTDAETQEDQSFLLETRSNDDLPADIKPTETEATDLFDPKPQESVESEAVEADPESVESKSTLESEPISESEKEVILETQITAGETKQIEPSDDSHGQEQEDACLQHEFKEVPELDQVLSPDGVFKESTAAVTLDGSLDRAEVEPSPPPEQYIQEIEPASSEIVEEIDPSHSEVQKVLLFEKEVESGLATTDASNNETTGEIQVQSVEDAQKTLSEAVNSEETTESGSGFVEREVGKDDSASSAVIEISNTSHDSDLKELDGGHISTDVVGACDSKDVISSSLTSTNIEETSKDLDSVGELHVEQEIPSEVIVWLPESEEDISLVTEDISVKTSTEGVETEIAEKFEITEAETCSDSKIDGKIDDKQANSTEIATDDSNGSIVESDYVPETDISTTGNAGGKVASSYSTKWKHAAILPEESIEQICELNERREVHDGITPVDDPLPTSSFVQENGNSVKIGNDSTRGISSGSVNGTAEVLTATTTPTESTQAFYSETSRAISVPVVIPNNKDRTIEHLNDTNQSAGAGTITRRSNWLGCCGMLDLILSKDR